MIAALQPDRSDPRVNTERGDLSLPRPWSARYSEPHRSWMVVDGEGWPVLSHLSERDARDIAASGK